MARLVSAKITGRITCTSLVISGYNFYFMFNRDKDHFVTTLHNNKQKTYHYPDHTADCIQMAHGLPPHPGLSRMKAPLAEVSVLR